jgi:cysteine desulfurase
MVYLDHAASTTIRPAAMAAWQDAAMLTGNPSSSHTSGRKGRRMLEEAREQIAANLGVKPDAIFFTSGGTEADNAAVLGTVNARRREDPRRDVVIVSPIEHKAVLEPIEGLAKSVQFNLSRTSWHCVGPFASRCTATRSKLWGRQGWISRFPTPPP